MDKVYSEAELKKDKEKHEAEEENEDSNEKEDSPEDIENEVLKMQKLKNKNSHDEL